MNYATRLDIGKKKRQSNGINEDSVAVSTFEFGHRDATRSAGVFVLADGAGGHSDGDVASYIATNHVSRELSSYVLEVVEGQPGAMDVAAEAEIGADTPSEAAVLGAIEDAIQSANRALVEYANDAGSGANPATTVVAAVLLGSDLYYGWVGDSRLYLLNRGDERLSLLTRDHSKVERMRQEGRIDEIEAEVHQEGNVILRALQGSAMESPEMATVEVDTGSAPVYEDDVLFLTSDGLIDAFVKAPQYHRQLQQAREAGEETMIERVREDIAEKSVTDDEIRDELLAFLGEDASSDDPMSAALDRLVELSNDRGGKDNISMALVERLSSRPAPDVLPARGIDEETDAEAVREMDTVIQGGDDDGGDGVVGAVKQAGDAVAKATDQVRRSVGDDDATNGAGDGNGGDAHAGDGDGAAE